jgi:hypothetical protein
LQNRLQAELVSHNTEGAKLTQDRISELQTQYTQQQAREEADRHQKIAIAATAGNEKLNREAAGQRTDKEIAAGDTRSANTIAADNERQLRGFGHADTAAAASHAFTHGENQDRLKHEDAVKAAALKAKTAGMNPEYVKQWAALQNNIHLLALTPNQVNSLQVGVLHYGGAGAAAHLKDYLAGKTTLPGITPADAQQMLTVFSGGQ